MKLVYRKRILERLIDLRTQSLREQREVEHVELTVAEARQLVIEQYVPDDSGFVEWLYNLGKVPSPQPPFVVLGMPVKVVPAT